MNIAPNQQQMDSAESETLPAEEGEMVEYRQLDEPEELHNYNENGHEHVENETEVQALNVTAPDFELTTLTGDTVRLSHFKGRKVFLNFWTTWCPPCIEEMPVIQHYYEGEAKADDVVVLSINATDLEFSRKDVEEFAGEHGITFPIMLDEKGEVSISYEVLTIPTSYIINEEGVITDQIIGPVTEEMLAEKLK